MVSNLDHNPFLAEKHIIYFLVGCYCVESSQFLVFCAFLDYMRGFSPWIPSCPPIMHSGNFVFDVTDVLVTSQPLHFAMSDVFAPINSTYPRSSPHIFWIEPGLFNIGMLAKTYMNETATLSSCFCTSFNHTYSRTTILLTAREAILVLVMGAIRYTTLTLLLFLLMHMISYRLLIME